MLNFAMSMGITVFMNRDISPSSPSVANPPLNAIVINMNWHNKKQLPFVIGHEITHILNSDKTDVIRSFSLGSKNKYERRANYGSIKLLIPFYLQTIEEKEQINANDFMKLFKIPNNLYDVCCNELKKQAI